MYFYKLLPSDRKLMLDKVLRKKHIYFSFLIILILPNIYSQALSGHKCGQLPNDVELNRSLNWGYGYEDLLSDLSVWGQSPYVTIDSKNLLNYQYSSFSLPTGTSQVGSKLKTISTCYLDMFSHNPSLLISLCRQKKLYYSQFLTCYMPS